MDVKSRQPLYPYSGKIDAFFLEPHRITRRRQPPQSFQFGVSCGCELPPPRRMLPSHPAIKRNQRETRLPINHHRRPSGWIEFSFNSSFAVPRWIFVFRFDGDCLRTEEGWCYMG